MLRILPSLIRLSYYPIAIKPLLKIKTKYKESNDEDMENYMTEDCKKIFTL